MELHERLNTARQPPTRRSGDPFAEVKNRIHFAVIGDLGRSSSTSAWTRTTCASASSRTSATSSHRRPGISRDDRQRIALEIADDILGHGPLERLLADDTVTEIMVNGPHDIWVERGGRLHETTCGSTTSRTCAASSTRWSPRSGGASTSPRRWSTRACRTAAASTRSSRRSRSPARWSRSASSAGSVSTLDDMIKLGTLDAETVEFLAALRPGRAEHPDLGRHRLRQDDAAERALDGDPRRRADRHHRGRGRAAAQPAPRAAARGAPEQHRGRGRSRDPRAGAQRAAHAPRPHHRRRGPRRRGARHAPGDEHRPRRLALDRPRQLPARRPRARRDDGADGRLSTCPSARSASRSRRRST